VLKPLHTMLRGVQRSQVVRLLQVMPNNNHSCMQVVFTTVHCLVLKQCRVALKICTEAGNVCLIGHAMKTGVSF